MALNGYVTAEDKRSRLVNTAYGLVVLSRRANQSQVYDIYRDGVLLGEVRKFSNWYVWPANLNAMRHGRVGAEEPHKTRQAAVEELMSALSCCSAQ